MDLKLIVNQPWEVLPSATPHASPTASTSTATSTGNPDFRDTDFRKPVLVPVKKLYLDSEQKEAIQSLYIDGREYRARFNATTSSQASAEQVLRTNGLSQANQTQNKLQSCWLTAWSSTWGSKKGSKKRSLFQCSSGYNTAARQARDKHVTWNRTSGQVERIIGYFEHSEKCEAAAVIRSVLRET
ncbi:hypothetical protein BJ322DRAFT_188440 [Thelephora terrestris]|uniref:Uncharacterized protein n=1 Tax=Thelephora terrestris TaxID=56493 RepID=A0A9P6HB92_9AGAM|nr:hypothetical protein BJ322DRAFT_188440 [Thelephora terrestris]